MGDGDLANVAAGVDIAFIMVGLLKDQSSQSMRWVAGIAAQLPCKTISVKAELCWRRLADAPMAVAFVQPRAFALSERFLGCSEESASDLNEVAACVFVWQRLQSHVLPMRWKPRAAGSHVIVLSRTTTDGDEFVFLEPP
jgi:hypothetical protein